MDDERSKPPFNKKSDIPKKYKGLGFIDFYVRPHLNSPHFPKVRDKNLRRIFRKLKNPLYALDDDSGIVFVDGNLRVVSEGKWKKYFSKGD